MFKKIVPKHLAIHDWIPQFPHCDPQVLHGPGECEFCDQHHEWQALRQAWGIAFTGWEPDESKKELPCPANYARDTDCQVGRAISQNQRYLGLRVICAKANDQSVSEDRCLETPWVDRVILTILLMFLSEGIGNIHKITDVMSVGICSNEQRLALRNTD